MVCLVKGKRDKGFVKGYSFMEIAQAILMAVVMIGFYLALYFSNLLNGVELYLTMIVLFATTFASIVTTFAVTRMVKKR